MTTTAQEALEHRDAMLDVFTEITQDCLLLGLTPVGVQLNRWSNGTLDVRVQLSGTDTDGVDRLAESWGLAADDGTTGNYTRDGRLDIAGRRVAVGVYTGRPKAPAFPPDYAPQAVEA